MNKRVGWLLLVIGLILVAIGIFCYFLFIHIPYQEMTATPQAYPPAGWLTSRLPYVIAPSALGISLVGAALLVLKKGK